MRFPKDEEVFVLDVVGVAADSRFLRESFFSRCSRCTGGGAGVFEAGREGADGTGAGVGAKVGPGIGAGAAVVCAIKAGSFESTAGSAIVG